MLYAKKQPHNSNIYLVMVSLKLLIVGCLLSITATSARKAERYNAKILPSTHCNKNGPVLDDTLINAVRQAVQMIPHNSCKDVLRSKPQASSGLYNISLRNGSLIQVYCDMEGINCGGERGWMRVAHLNTTDALQKCPANFKLEQIANSTIKVCVKNNSSAGCQSIPIEAHGVSFSQVCGSVRGYQFASTDAFGERSPSLTNITGNYVDGVSITYDKPPTHIWTYVSGHTEEGKVFGDTLDCPCNTNGTNASLPSFVGEDYYCESGASDTPKEVWYTDPLWDGEMCQQAEIPCCNITGLPWFHKTLQASSTANLNMRVCLNENFPNENVGVEAFEIYIK